MEQRVVLSIFLLLVAMTSIQMGASFAKQLFPLLGPAGTTVLRTGLAACLLLAIWRPWKRSFSRKQMQAVMFYGASLGAMNLLFYSSLARIPLGIAVALEFTGPLGLAVFASRRLTDWLWVLLAVAGLLLLLPIHREGLDPIGIAFALAAGACWALYIVFGQKVGSSLRSGDATAMGMVVAALVATPFGLTDALPHLNTLHTWLLAASIAVLSSALPYSLEMIALRHLPRPTFGILMSIEPALAALMGFIFLSEHLLPVHGLAIFFIMAASAGSARGFSPPPRKPVAEGV